MKSREASKVKARASVFVSRREIINQRSFNDARTRCHPPRRAITASADEKGNECVGGNKNK